MRWKRIKSFFRGVRQLFFLLIFAVFALLAYLHFNGLPQSWKNSVLQELAQRGVHLKIESLHLDPLRGVVAHGVEFESRDVGGAHVKVGEIALHVDLGSMLRKRFALETVEADGSDIQIELRNLQRLVTIRRTSGKFRFAGNGVVELKSVVGDSLGLHVEINGRLDLSKGKTGAASSSFSMNLDQIRSWLTRLASVKTSTPIQLRIQVDGKVSEPDTLRLKAELDGKSVAYERWRADAVRGSFSYENKVLTVPEVMIEVNGGKAVFSGSWDVAPGKAKFELDNNLDPNALLIRATGQSAGLLKGIEFGVRPEFRVKGQLDVAEAAAKNWKSLQAEVSFRVRELSWRGHLVRDASGDALILNGRIMLPNLSIERESGRLTGSFEYDLAAEALKFDFTSTLDIAEGMELLYPSEKNWFRTARYTKPPLLRLAGQWRIRDSQGLEGKGDIDWQDWFSSGVAIRSTKSRVEIVGRKFYFHDLRLRRDEGEIAGEFSMDFEKQNAYLNATSTISFTELTRIIGPTTEETFRPYLFLTPPRIQFRGKVNFGGEETNDLWTHVECERFQIWKFKASKVAADIHSYRRSLEIARYKSDFYDGRLTGDAVFDFSTPEGEWAFHCHVDKADFDRLTHDLWDYNEVKGRMTGWGKINGILLNSRPLKGRGEVKVTDGVLWRIPLFGELSKFIPLLGVQKATKAVAGFTIADEKVHIENMKVDAGIMSLTAKGDYKFDESVDFIVQGHFLRWLFGFGFVFDPFTKAFEYHLGGKLTERKWKPRFLPKELLFQFDDEDAPEKPKS